MQDAKVGSVPDTICHPLDGDLIGCRHPLAKLTVSLGLGLLWPYMGA